MKMLIEELLLVKTKEDWSSVYLKYLSTLKQRGLTRMLEVITKKMNPVHEQILKMNATQFAEKRMRVMGK